MSEQSAKGPLIGRAVAYKRLGGPEVIEVVERHVRAPAANEVRIEVKAAAVNPTDILLRNPNHRSTSVQPVDPTLLIVPGMDAAGIIESVGSSVSRLHPGQKVMAVIMPRRPEGGAQARLDAPQEALGERVPQRLADRLAVAGPAQQAQAR